MAVYVYYTPADHLGGTSAVCLQRQNTLEFDSLFSVVLPVVGVLDTALRGYLYQEILDLLIYT